MIKPKRLASLAGATLMLTACAGTDANGVDSRPPTEGVETTTTLVISEATTTLPALATTTTPATPDSTVPDLTEATGVVIDVQGNLQVTDSFTLFLEDGSQIVLVPAPDLLFDGGPLSHLRDDMASGAPVYAVYVVDRDGTNIAIEVGDTE